MVIPSNFASLEQETILLTIFKFKEAIVNPKNHKLLISWISLRKIYFKLAQHSYT